MYSNIHACVLLGLTGNNVEALCTGGPFNLRSTWGDAERISEIKGAGCWR